MRIPDVQAELYKLADVLHSTRLRELANQLSRRPRHRGTRQVAKSMTPEIRDRIRAIAEDFPDLTNVEIAARVGVNPGRVSEILHGFRE